MIIHECIDIFDNKIVSISFFFTTFFGYINDMFFFILIHKNTNVNGIVFFNFMFISVKIDWKFHFFKIKLFSKTLISFCDSSWIMVCRMQVSDKTPFKAFILINILNINQSFFWWSHSFGNFIKLLPVRECTLKYCYYDLRLNQ